MKYNNKAKLNTLFILFFGFLNIKCQTVINMAGGNGTLPSNFNETGQYYVKDINNYLDNFTGTWEYVNGNEKFQIVLTKMVKYHDVEPLIDLNIYKDGIQFQYKEYLNNNLTYASPVKEYPTFKTTDGVILKGYMTDYGRITRTIYSPYSTSEVFVQGGYPLSALCDIKKIANNPQKIKFHIELEPEFPNYDKQTYAGQPKFSIPNDVEMTKVP